MPTNKPVQDTELIQIMIRQYGVKSTVMYHLRKAKDAAGRARVDLANQNPHSLGANTQQMIDAIEMVYKILGDDENTLPTEK